MARPQEVQEWLTVIRAAMPTVASIVELGVAGIRGLIAMFRRGNGQPAELPGDEELAAAILAAAKQAERDITNAQKPFATIGDVARDELAAAMDRLRREGK